MVDVMSSSGMETAFRASTYVTHLRPSLFPGGVGKTWRDGDFEQLLGDVTSRVFNVYGTRRWSTRAMATTRRWEMSARISMSGKNVAGRPKRKERTRT